MYINKIIKREVTVLIISVLAVAIVIIGISFALFFSIDKGEENIIKVGDLEVTYCNDTECKKKYNNYGQVIGTTTKDGIVSPSKMYPYNTAYDALKTIPYIFNIKNTGTLDSYVTIKLLEDKDFINKDEHLNYVSTAELYNEHIRVGISNCTNEIDRENVNVLTYGELDNYIIMLKDFLSSDEDKTYCLWTWLDESTPNSAQNTYFVANIDIEAEYIPEK